MFSKTFVVKNEAETIKLAEEFAKLSHKKDIYALHGTLGVGKSVFARAFIQALTKAKEVPSPTFTLVQSYLYRDYEIYHFDLYRLKYSSEVYELGFEEALYNGICLIEWPEKAGQLLPKDTFKIEISLQNNNRIFNITVISDEKAKRLEQINAL